MYELDKLDFNFISVCPERAGGLDTPRPQAELQNSSKKIINGDGRVLTKDGINVTANFIHGSKKELDRIKDENSTLAILKSRSPSCGLSEIYDGSFSGKLCSGNGIFSQMCIDEGIEVISSDHIDTFIEDIKAKE